METLRLPSMLAFLLATTTTDGARILVFQHAHVRSHSIVVEPLFEELAARGHQLTVVTSFPHKSPVQNLRELDVSYRLPKVVSDVSFEFIKDQMPNPLVTALFQINLELWMCEKILPEPVIQSLWRSAEKFDLVMTEVFSSDCYTPFAHKFDAPLISFVTSCPLPWVADRVGLPDNPAYIPNYYVDYSSEMTFFERLYNSVVLVLSKLLFNKYGVPRTQNLVEKYLGHSMPPIDSLIKNTSLIFLNNHIAISHSRPLPPNVVDIGGIHIRESSEQLPKDLQNILDQSSNGVILMSFGSQVKASSIPPSVIQMFMNVFSKLPQTVIFKYEEELPEAPPNVIVRKWLPQRKIIEHKNVKLLLAHGGLGSTIEAVHFGKPLVGIPFFADQYLNVKAVVRKGAGVMLDLDSLTEQRIETAIKDVLSSPKYKENMNRLSQQFRDRPMTPLQSAVYWTEYVIRHQGAPHLRPASVGLPFYQYLLLDVIAVLLVAVAATLTCLFIISKWVLIVLQRSSSKFKTDVF